MVDRDTMRRRYVAELEQLRALAPPDVTTELTATLAQLRALETQREHLVAGTGPYRTSPIGRIARQLHELDIDLGHARTEHANSRPWQRPRWQRHITTLESYQAATIEEWDQHGRPEAARIGAAIHGAEERVEQLHTERRFNQRWHRDHPEHAARVRQLEAALANLEAVDTPSVPAGLDQSTDRDLIDIIDAAHADLETANAAHDAHEAGNRMIARLDALQHAPEPERDVGRDFGI